MIAHADSVPRSVPAVEVVPPRSLCWQHSHRPEWGAPRRESLGRGETRPQHAVNMAKCGADKVRVAARSASPYMVCVTARLHLFFQEGLLKHV